MLIMPIYEYHCSACEEEFELFQKITDKPTSTCPKCGSSKVKKLVSSTSFTLKGGGWYKDGYTSSKKPKEAKKPGDIPKKQGKKSSDKKKN